MSAQEDFDLSAAGLRADGSDLRISIEALASKLEASLPSQTTVQRRGTGLLGRGEKHVQSIEVRLGEVSYELSVSGVSVQGVREKRVGGISIKREPLSPSEWVGALAGALRDEAQQSAAARVALEGLLA
ncbi:MAG: hypothetical protein ACTHM1_08720 [Solirubrobacteraceae bacterium]